MGVLNEKMCKRRTKKENDFTYNTCKKTFCNEKCEGYDFFGNKQKQIDFNKTIKNGFSNSYSKDKVEMFKKKVLYLVVLK